MTHTPTNPNNPSCSGSIGNNAHKEGNMPNPNPNPHTTAIQRVVNDVMDPFSDYIKELESRLFAARDVTVVLNHLVFRRGSAPGYAANFVSKVESIQPILDELLDTVECFQHPPFSDGPPTLNSVDDVLDADGNPVTEVAPGTAVECACECGQYEDGPMDDGPPTPTPTDSDGVPTYNAPDSRSLARRIADKGRAFWRDGRLGLAISEFEYAAAMYERLDDDSQRDRYVATAEYVQSLLDSEADVSRGIREDALKIAKDAAIYVRSNDLKDAIDANKVALRLFGSIKDEHGMLMLQLNLRDLWAMEDIDPDTQFAREQWLVKAFYAEAAARTHEIDDPVESIKAYKDASEHFAKVDGCATSIERCQLRIVGLQHILNEECKSA